VFASDRDGDWDIYVRRSNGDVEPLTVNGHNDRNPVWHPDGDFIAFESQYDGDWELLRMNTDGTDVRSYTFNTTQDIDPVWKGNSTTDY
jgi:TolB protein